MKLTLLLCSLLPAFCCAVLSGEPAPPPATLQEALGERDLPAAWIYDDVAAGFAEAKKTGKPLLFVFR